MPLFFSFSLSLWAQTQNLRAIGGVCLVYPDGGDGATAGGGWPGGGSSFHARANDDRRAPKSTGVIQLPPEGALELLMPTGLTPATTAGCLAFEGLGGGAAPQPRHASCFLLLPHAQRCSLAPPRSF